MKERQEVYKTATFWTVCPKCGTEYEMKTMNCIECYLAQPAPNPPERRSRDVTREGIEEKL